MVYKTFKPFDYETGEGIVAAPGEAELLRPSQFSQDHLPDLGKVWSAQERLWIQRTVLEVVAEVNKNAKSWDDAVIREIDSLEVGNPDSQDQRSLAKSETLQESEGIYAPGEEPAAADAGGGIPTGGSVSRPGGVSGGGGGMMGGGGGGGMMGGASATESVYYVKSDSDKYKILPIAVTVLIDQDRVQDFLIELENSPMSIQVKDFELLRPASRVTKPVKGDSQASYGMMMMGGGMMGGGMMGGRSMMGGNGMSGGSGMVGMGGMAGQMEQMLRSQQQQMAADGQYGNGGRMGGGMGGAAAKKKTGKDMRNVDLKEKRKANEKAAEEAKGPSLFDPYYDIVQVKVYGQARFFAPPPEEPAAEPSSGETAAAAAAPETPAKNAKADEAAAAGDEKPGAAKDAEKATPDAGDEKPGAAKAAEKAAARRRKCGRDHQAGGQDSFREKSVSRQ